MLGKLRSHLACLLYGHAFDPINIDGHMHLKCLRCRWTTY
jgi:hypothetical protein